MKNILLIMTGLVFLLGSCQKPVQIDVSEVKFVEETPNWEVHVEKSDFSSADPKVNKACVAVNEAIQKRIDTLQAQLKKDADDLFSTFEKDTINRPVWSYQLYVSDTVLMADENYISVRMQVYTFTGGAHGMTGFDAFNYDIKRQAFVSADQVLNFKEAEKLNDLLARNFKDEQGCFTDKPTLTNGFTAFNLTPTAVCFTYPQYVLGPYSCGVAEVYIPRTELQGLWLK